MEKLILLLAAILLLSSCASTGVIETDSGIYMIAKKSAQFGYGPPDAVKADVYTEANEFCAKTNKGVETIKIEVTNAGFGRPGNVSLTFRCK